MVGQRNYRLIRLQIRALDYRSKCERVKRMAENLIPKSFA
jgi:hypothetical protein